MIDKNKHQILEIEKNPDAAYNYTWKGNTIAIVSDGSAVLGQGTISPAAAMPVMKGKAVLLKHFGGVNAVPLCINTQDPEEMMAGMKDNAIVFAMTNPEPEILYEVAKHAEARIVGTDVLISQIKSITY